MNDRGAALIMVMLTAGLLAALGMSLVLVSDSERRVAANAGYAAETFAAADAGLERALVDVRRSAAWSAILAGAERSSFFDGSRNTDAATAELQAESDAAGNLGANTPIWKPFASGPLSAVGGAAPVASAAYVTVWVADDPSDSDADPHADSNGMLTLRSEARGFGGARRSVEATVARTASASLKVVSWREVW